MPDTLVNVVLPDLGESVSEGSVTGWRKRVGDFVAEGEALVDVTTDKVDVEIPSPAAGKLARIIAESGATVTVGGPLGEIDTSVQEPVKAAPRAQTGTPAGQPAQAEIGSTSKDTAATPPKPERRASSTPATAGGPPVATLLARRAAQRRGVDLSGVKGTGPGGLIRFTDVVAAGDGETEVLGRAFARPTTPVVLKGPAAALVGAMEESLGIPTATSIRTLSADVMDARRRELNERLAQADRKEKVSFTHLIGFAMARATRDVPVMATNFRRSASGPERVARGVHLGLAVDTRRKDGSRLLVVPVILDADKLDFAAFHRAYEALVEKARGNALTMTDTSGATLTLTNPGGIGTVASVPRLMAGQGCIIAAGAIGYPPGLGGIPQAVLSSLGVGKIVTLTSTYDHRIIQGAESGEYLRRIDELLGGADGFYEDIYLSLDLGAPEAVQALGRAEQARLPQPSQVPVGAVRVDHQTVRAAAAGMALVVRYRVFGHTAAELDPLGTPPVGDPALDPATLGLTREIMEVLPAAAFRVYVPGRNLADVLDKLRETYCSTIAYEVEHITNHEQRTWLREQIESGAHRRLLTADQKVELLDQLTSVDAFEKFLRRAYLGQKTFSIEGLDVMVPMLEHMLRLFADDGTREVDLGMAHRGRLSVITHLVGRPFEEVLTEFEQAEIRGKTFGDGDVTGDVKYHQGAAGPRVLGDGRQIHVVLVHNPSHLEAVDSVVEGRGRAVQTDRSANMISLDRSRAVPVLVHGDAAFTGQGSLAEVFNLQSLDGYSTGGTVHLIANNQLGFTTLPAEARSTRYASDLAKGFDVPIIHVNADDVEACIAAAQLAVEFRRRFARDVVIDLIGYRRFGHNETDEPGYTQPLMYERIRNHPSARELYVRRLVADGVITEEDAQRRFETAQKRLADARHRVRGAQHKTDEDARRVTGPNGASVDTRVPLPVLQRLNRELAAVPDGFAINPKLVRQLERRRAALDSPEGDIDWAIAETLAFASLLLEGNAIRLTGQDTERGTFSHRHLGLYDVKTGRRWIPMQHIDGARASFEIYNSPLSEFACMGFEYGYSAAAPEALVLWEAQFGDFANGGQVIIDQFIAAGMAKWGQPSRLVLLLPHGYEGAGPEHSSARLERFLQLAAEGNLRIANCSTPGQYFHLLRDQSLSPRARPLVVMTPKSLLRLKASSSRPADLAEGRFQVLIDDPSVADRETITRVILCSGKIYYDLTGHDARAQAKDLAIVRVELLEPFPLDDVLALIASYPNVRQVSWVQEEPKNMGARAFVSRRIRERLLPQGIAFDYVGRPDRASPSEGYPGAHAVEQERIIKEALKVDHYI